MHFVPKTFICQNTRSDGQITSDYRKYVSRPEMKNISLFRSANQWHIYRHPVPTQRGVGHRHERGTGMRWTRRLQLTSAAEAYGKDVWS